MARAALRPVAWPAFLAGRSLVAELVDMLDLAVATKNPGAGVASIMAKARLLGFVVDKAEINRPFRTPTTDSQISVDEWVKRFAPKRVDHGSN